MQPLIDRHGDKAPIQSTLQANAMLAEGDMHGRAVER